MHGESYHFRIGHCFSQFICSFCIFYDKVTTVVVVTLCQLNATAICSAITNRRVCNTFPPFLIYRPYLWLYDTLGLPIITCFKLAPVVFNDIGRNYHPTIFHIFFMPATTSSTPHYKNYLQRPFAFFGIFQQLHRRYHRTLSSTTTYACSLINYAGLPIDGNRVVVVTALGKGRVLFLSIPCKEWVTIKSAIPDMIGVLLIGCDDRVSHPKVIKNRPVLILICNQNCKRNVCDVINVSCMCK